MIPIYSYEVKVQVDELKLSEFIGHCVLDLADRDEAIVKEEVILAFVSAEKSQELNSKFRGKDRSTDVLSFKSEDPDSLGELVLCPEVIENNAKKNSWSSYHEYCYMVLHGLLHLLGYDHEKDDKAAEEMYGLQDSIFFKYFPGEK